MEKAALFVFNGDPMCFVHVLLNAIDMNERGIDVGVVIEGAATGLVPELEKSAHPLNRLWKQVLTAGLVAGACRACATKTGVLEACEQQALRLLGDMNGHPPMSAYLDQGYELITF